MTVSVEDTRAIVEDTVRERARHDTSDKVGDTRSFANMEQTLTREYWGRFLIELLQNARDAWLRGDNGSRDGLLRIRLTRDPALVVCNEGEPLSSEVVLHSISKFGESPKAHGEGIGHKGIGFKAVLELTHAPRLYSRAKADATFDLQIRFDPDEAWRLIRQQSPDWDQLESSLPSAGVDHAIGDHIPILRFPLWDASPPAWLDDVVALDGRGFNTVIALPYDPRFDARLEITESDFVERVRRAFADVSDEVVLLLGVFGRIVIEDEIAGSVEEITRSSSSLPTNIPNAVGHDVAVYRDGALSSRWWLFEREIPGSTGLEGDMAVGVRLNANEVADLAPAVPRDDVREHSTADCFHLFFPTRIRTHLPYLFHAYFEVDAGRKSFAEDRATENQQRLDGLRSLAIGVTRHLVEAATRREIEATGLARIFAETKGDPEDPLAHAFREALLRDLDRLAWVAAPAGDRFVAPHDLLIDDRAELPALLPTAFPAAYVRRRLGRDYPDTTDPSALGFLAARNAISRGNDRVGLDGDSLRDLLHPQGDRIWDENPDEGFRALVDVLDVTRRDADVSAVLDELSTDTTAAFIPVVDRSGGRRLRAPGRRQLDPDSDEPDVQGAILARVTATGELPLAPPASLGLDFVADGLFDAERLATVGPKLGIRPYQTEVIIDALAARRDDPSDDPDLLRFVWRLLLRERGRYSVVGVLRTSSTFEPGRWFWSRPDGNRTEPEREELRRARAIAHLRLPTASGTWRPAIELAFGEDWAEWLDFGEESLGQSAAVRAAAYRDLAAVAPGPDSIVASPAELATEMPLVDEDIGWANSDTGPELPADTTERHVFLLHALLLRLGVWEVPPIRGHVNYRHPRADSDPAWGSDPLWQRLHAAWQRSGGSFADFTHGNVYVAEDYALLWPLRSGDALVRALSRGANFYRGYRRAELFCPQCSPGTGRWHTKRYSSEGDERIQSFLMWQLSHEAWVPTTTWGSPAKPVRAREAWYEDDRPDDARMQQSWMRYLPLATIVLAPELARLVKVRRLSEADVPRVVRLLGTLRERFEAGEIDPDHRGFASQAFIGLHWRLYQQLADRDPLAGRAGLDKVGVLATLGRSLVFRDPAACRHDDGTLVALRRYFSGQLPFVVLTREQGPAADAVGIERFRVGVARISGGSETPVTAEVRPFVHDRAAEFLALQAFHPIGARALQLDGREFPLRAERLRRLEVVRVDDLVLRLSVPGTKLTKQVGAGRGQDMYLDLTVSPPVLFHDLAGSRWEDRFRALAGPHIAALLENPAYAATFQLLLQAETEADVEAFLDERSISPEDLDLVRAQIEAATGAVRAEERRWWTIVLGLLGGQVPSHSAGEAFRRELLAQLQAVSIGSPVQDLAARLFRAGGGESTRHNGSVDGPLAALETHGIDLYALHQLLTEAGDRGIGTRVSANRLAEWRRQHGREVAAILARHGMDADLAKTRPDAWTLAPEVAFRIRSTPQEYLSPVTVDLRLVGLEVDPGRLVGDDVVDYLAGLAGVAPSDLAHLWLGMYDAEERARLARERASAWRRVLRPVVISARTRPGDPAHLIRTEASSVDAQLSAAPETSTELIRSLRDALIGNAALADMLADEIENDRSLAEPTLNMVRPDLGPFVDLEHLDRVIAVLQRGKRQLVDQVRQDIALVQERGLVPTPFAGAQPTGQPERRRSATKTTVRPRRAHDQRVRDRLGQQGERVALATVLNDLLGRPRVEQDGIIDQLATLLADVGEGPIVDRLVADARSAQAAIDDDDRLESLISFLHVAQASDDFGFDLLGFLSPYVGAPPSPLLLEVKSSANRRFIVSVPEWRRAEEQGDRYAFLVVVRGTKNDAPATLELVPDPSELLRLGQIARDEESWSVAYTPAVIAAPKGGGRATRG